MEMDKQTKHEAWIETKVWKFNKKRRLCNLKIKIKNFSKSNAITKNVNDALDTRSVIPKDYLKGRSYNALYDV